MLSFELSSKKYKNGRRPFKAVLYELQPPECVVDETGTKFNKNGITFLEKYATQALDSIEDMSVRVEFIDDDRTLIAGHGLTDVKDGFPIFGNATTVGHFTKKGYIADVEINGEIKRCVCGEGYLDEMAYQPFIQSLDEQLKSGAAVEGSVEIYRTENNNAIVYEYGWKPKGRIPKEYIHSGWDMVINPADNSSTLLELNNSKKKKEDNILDEKVLKDLIQSTIVETNSKTDELNATIIELNSQVADKDATITELNATIDELREAKKKLEEEHDTYWEEIELLRQEIAKIKIKEKLDELDSAIGEFNEEEQAVAKDDIEKVKENINACEDVKELESVSSEINSIVSKICTEIVKSQKRAEAEKQTLETNSQKETETIDIFSEICEEHSEANDNEEVDIFA